jgi:hypothetical protein
MFKYFKKNETPNSERSVRELLTENLNLISFDMFSTSDPLVGLTSEERKIYLKYFADMYADKKLIERIQYHINKQSIKTLSNSKEGVTDVAGAMTVNGLAYVMEDIKRLANMHVKESSVPPPKPMDQHRIIPQMKMARRLMYLLKKNLILQKRLKQIEFKLTTKLNLLKKMRM